MPLKGQIVSYLKNFHIDHTRVLNFKLLPGLTSPKNQLALMVLVVHSLASFAKIKEF